MGYLFMYYMAECWPVKPKGKVLTKVYQKIGNEISAAHLEINFRIGYFTNNIFVLFCSFE